MIGRPMMRRRPLLRAAAVGGTFAAGRAMGRRAEQRDDAEATQDQRISNVEDQQAAAQQVPAQAGPQPPAGPPASVLDQLNQLTAMHQQGALTDEEFAAAKAKVLGSS